MPEIAIVTGGGNGIGRCVCLRFARAGMRLAIVDADNDAALRVSEEVVAMGGEARAYRADVRKAHEVELAVEQVKSDFGGIDVLANLAGGTIYSKPVEELTWTEWREVIDVNLKGTFLFCRLVAREMMGRQRGRIVNTSSNYGLTGCALRTPYSAAKAGVIGLTKSLAHELAPYGVLANVVAPGPTDTPRVLSVSTPEAREKWKPLIPMGRTGQPEDVAEAFYFLASPENSYITGYTLHVNGGLVVN